MIFWKNNYHFNFYLCNQWTLLSVAETRGSFLYLFSATALGRKCTKGQCIFLSVRILVFIFVRNRKEIDFFSRDYNVISLVLYKYKSIIFMFASCVLFVWCSKPCKKPFNSLCYPNVHLHPYPVYIIAVELEWIGSACWIIIAAVVLNLFIKAAKLLAMLRLFPLHGHHSLLPVLNFSLTEQRKRTVVLQGRVTRDVTLSHFLLKNHSCFVQTINYFDPSLRIFF